MSRPEVVDFETFAAQRGASRQDIGDCGTHMSRASVSIKQTQRVAKRQWRRDDDLVARRDALRAEYMAALERGEIREPTQLERLMARAQGAPDLASTQAARRCLARRGIDFPPLEMEPQT